MRSFYIYDGDGNIVLSIDISDPKEYNYIYDDGNLSSCVEYDITIGSNEIITSRTKVCHVVMAYNEEGTLVEKTITFSDGSTREITYSQNNNNNTETVGFTVNGSSVTHTSNTDGFGRAKCDETLTGSGSIGREFFYLAGAPSAIHNENNKNKGNPTTNLVSQIKFSNGRTISYEYDEEERITKVTDSIDGVTEYTYDALGQLLTETKNNVRINTMTYDNYGNIAVKNGIQYSYDDNWHDKLICYNGQEITYDDQGNPTTYLGHTLTWEKGRQLKTFDCNTYTYNANGIRTSKTINGVTHTYTLEGTKILRETWGNNVLESMYDVADSVIGIIYNGTPYYFHKNLQGDIIAIVNKDAATVAKYSYDAWGVCTINQDSVGIANINPFRYRGYYYDEEIGMYYLQSRYYDASVGRFVNGDSIEWIGTTANILEANIFAYCKNNCVNRTDDIGYGGVDALLNVLSSCIGIITGVIDMIGNSYNKERKQLESSVKFLAKKQRRKLSDIKALQNETKKISKRLGWIGHAITFLTIVIGFAVSFKTGSNIDHSIIEIAIEAFIAVIEWGAGEFFSMIAKLMPYVGFLLGLIAGWLVSYLLGKYFNNKRVKRIKLKYYSLVKNTRVSLGNWVKSAVKSLTA